MCCILRGHSAAWVSGRAILLDSKQINLLYLCKQWGHIWHERKGGWLGQSRLRLFTLGSDVFPQRNVKIVLSWTEREAPYFQPPTLLSECFCHRHICSMPSLFSSAYAGVASPKHHLFQSIPLEKPLGWNKECVILISFWMPCILLRRPVALSGVIQPTGIKGCHLEILLPWPLGRFNVPQELLPFVISKQISGVNEHSQTPCCDNSEEEASPCSPSYLAPQCGGGNDKVFSKWHRLSPWIRVWTKHL